MGKIKLFLAASMLMLSGQAKAALVNYDELVSGDLVHGLPFTELTNVGTFDIGINTVSGNIMRQIGGGGDTSDSFLFDIAEGHQLNSATIYFFVTGLANMSFQLAKIDDIDDQTQFYNENTTISLTADPTTSSALAFSAVMPETSGTFSVNSPGNYDFTNVALMFYTWEFEVVAVPAPAAIWLFGTGLLGLIGAKWRRKAA
jgi:hypothetical protein